MMCAWKELLSILPVWMRNDVDILGKHGMQELRLRVNSPPELVFSDKIIEIQGKVTRDDMNYLINTASHYSPWSASTMAKGYITASGGHRIGVCGEAVVHQGVMTGIRDVNFACVRVARDYPGIGVTAAREKGSLLILGAPGWGKTTLLRDIVRQRANQQCISVIDERGELFPSAFLCGRRTDVLTGCPKTIGIEMVLRTMGPECIAVDEITEREDCEALIRAANCGVELLATAHAASVSDFMNRKVYRSLIENCIFPKLLVLHRDKSYLLERMTV